MSERSRPKDTPPVSEPLYRAAGKAKGLSREHAALQGAWRDTTGPASPFPDDADRKAWTAFRDACVFFVLYEAQELADDVIGRLE